MKIHGVIFGCAMGLTLSGVSGAEKAPSPTVSEGERLAAELTLLYEATPSRCKDDQAAYKCSGVMIRGTRQTLPEGQGAWEPYPRGRTLDTSFTYVRADIRVPRLAWHYSNGFIIAPPQALSVKCFYPVDAVSDERIDKGCGPNKDYRYNYSLCEVLPADAMVMERDANSEEYRWAVEQLADLWLEWDRQFTDSMRRRCAYRLDDAYATQRFEVALAVAAKASQQADKPNDMKVQTWDPGHDPRLPIKAFFYINDQGKPFAQRDRDQFEKATKIHLPLLKITLSETMGEPLRFESGE